MSYNAIYTIAQLNIDFLQTTHARLRFEPKQYEKSLSKTDKNSGENRRRLNNGFYIIFMMQLRFMLTRLNHREMLAEKVKPQSHAKSGDLVHIRRGGVKSWRSLEKKKKKGMKKGESAVRNCGRATAQQRRGGNDSVTSYCKKYTFGG